MRFTPLLLFFVCLSSCSLKMIPLKGNYPTLPITETTSTQFDAVWEHLIDFISQRGYSVKLIDRSSGFLVMDDYSFRGVFTTEDKTGMPREKRAFLVTSGYREPSTRQIAGPSRVTGNFNIRMKKSGDGTLINVNLTNLQAYGLATYKGVSTYTEAMNYQIKSTGVFERMIIDYIK